MGIGVGQASLLRVLAKKNVLNNLNTVCELGSQVPIASELKITLFDVIDVNPPKGDYKAIEFYKKLGFDKYVSLDLDGMDNALKYDLNVDLKSNYDFTETFNLVTNFGTTEHCFEQGTVFKNIHELCKIGGYMLHTVPSQGWHNHSFYRYDTNFFEDIAEANSYKLIYLAPYTRLQPRKLNSSRLLRNRRMRPILKILELTNKVKVNTTLICVLKKTNNNDFVIPIQGMYQESCKK